MARSRVGQASEQPSEELLPFLDQTNDLIRLARLRELEDRSKEEGTWHERRPRIDAKRREILGQINGELIRFFGRGAICPVCNPVVLESRPLAWLRNCIQHDLANLEAIGIQLLREQRENSAGLTSDGSDFSKSTPMHERSAIPPTSNLP